MKLINAVVLLSGGIDSQTCLAVAKKQGYNCYALAVDYGQKHRVELESAAMIANSMGVAAFRIAKVNLGEMPGAALTDSNTKVPAHDPSQKIKSTYFPARNTIFLSLALAWAESVNAKKIYIGANLDDFHGFPDTRPDYFAAFTAMAQLATRSGVEQALKLSIETPLITLDKKAIIQLGLELGVDFSLSTTCYRAEARGYSCGTCDSCVIRRNAFSALGIVDPAVK